MCYFNLSFVFSYLYVKYAFYLLCKVFLLNSSVTSVYLVNNRRNLLLNRVSKLMWFFILMSYVRLIISSIIWPSKFDLCVTPILHVISVSRSMATNGVSETQPKPEVDSGAGDAPERTPDHAKLLENGLNVKIANKLDDIFKTGQYIDFFFLCFRCLFNVSYLMFCLRF